MESSVRPAMFFLANGVLSMISDNVFVATVYISEVKQALDNGVITRAEFDQLAIAINTEQIYRRSQHRMVRLRFCSC